MQRKQLWAVALIALALAGLLSLALLRAPRAAEAPPALVAVVGAARGLQPGEPLQASDLKLLRLPAAALPAHVFHSPSQLAGHALVTAAAANQVIVGEMVAAPGAGVGLPPLIPPGMRAVSVKVNDVVSVAGFAIPGTRVDVLLTGNPSATSDPGAVTTITLLQNVQVLTAGQQMERPPGGKPETVTVITLLVDPAGAEKLALADGYGRLQLALRNPLDRGAQQPAPVHNAALYRGAGPAPHASSRAPAAAARPRPAPAWGVELIVGNQHQRVILPSDGPAKEPKL